MSLLFHRLHYDNGCLIVFQVKINNTFFRFSAVYQGIEQLFYRKYCKKKKWEYLRNNGFCCIVIYFEKILYLKCSLKHLY